MLYMSLSRMQVYYLHPDSQLLQPMRRALSVSGSADGETRKICVDVFDTYIFTCINVQCDI